MPNFNLNHLFNLRKIDKSWQECFQYSFSRMDSAYLKSLNTSKNWLPGRENIFNAFTLPLEKANYILFGESPYPRVESANGYAFWDACVEELWSKNGLSKKANRATSLRNLIKMLLVAEGELDKHHTSQANIAKINKTGLVQTNAELFQNFINHGFLLLNAALVLHPRDISSPQKDAQAWRPFIQNLLASIVQKKPNIYFILLGTIAKKIDKLIDSNSVHKIYAEHPYNISFITNQTILDFFKPLQLLKKA